MNDSIQVDIVIPCFNRKALLDRAISSVVEQSYRHWKLWIVDDGSRDGTSAHLENTWKQNIPASRFAILSQAQNRGVSHARNRGIQAGSAPWVAFLDSDDEWLPSKLAKQMDFCVAHPHLPLVHTNELWRKNGRHLNQKKIHAKQGGRIFINCLPLCLISPSTALIQRAILHRFHGFREDFPACEDYDLWLKITSHFEVGFLSEPLVIKHGGHADQLSRQVRVLDHWRLKALQPFLSAGHLSPEEQRKVREVFTEKCHLLIRGYTRHGHPQKAHQVQQMLDACDPGPAGII